MKITKFQFRRVEKGSVAFQKNFARIQVNNGSQTFHFKKTVSGGATVPTMDFSDANNSQYIPLTQV